jgi:hypothetical protein
LRRKEPVLNAPDVAHLVIAQIYDLAALTMGATRDAAEVATMRLPKFVAASPRAVTQQPQNVRYDGLVTPACFSCNMLLKSDVPTCRQRRAVSIHGTICVRQGVSRPPLFSLYRLITVGVETTIGGMP